jgi:N-formylglutamate deformylase
MTPPPPFRFRAGTRPLLISMPHVGTYLPPALAGRLSDAAQAIPDTDWHLETLYDFADTLGASVLVATHSRYVIDLNRPPDDASLYPGHSGTGLCPVDTFDGAPLYRELDDWPTPPEIAVRRETLWQPYHDQLQAELQRLRTTHGVALLWDAHSIRSIVPRFFVGRLPDLNLGTADGASCDPALAAALLDRARQAGAPGGFSAVLNGRFKGGHITRHHGRPVDGIHAVQLEMTQCSYMDEQAPFTFRPDRAEAVRPVLQSLLETALAWAQAR